MSAQLVLAALGAGLGAIVGGARGAAVGAGAGLAVGTLLSSKTSSASTPTTPTPKPTPQPDEPPPDQPKPPPPAGSIFENNPVGGFPGVQHMLVDLGTRLPLDYTGFPPPSIEEAAKQNFFFGPAFVYEGSTAYVETSAWPYIGPGPGRYIVRNKQWVPWNSSMGPDVGFGPVVFQWVCAPGATFCWRRIVPP